MAMTVRGEERYCAFCYVNRNIKVDAYVCMKYRFNESWWDLCEEHFAEHPTRSVDDDDVVLLINEGPQFDARIRALDEAALAAAERAGDDGDDAFDPASL
jgi:hypothetical protein